MSAAENEISFRDSENTRHVGGLDSTWNIVLKVNHKKQAHSN